MRFEKDSAYKAVCVFICDIFTPNVANSIMIYYHHF